MVTALLLQCKPTPCLKYVLILQMQFCQCVNGLNNKIKIEPSHT